MGESAFQEIEHTADWALRVRGQDHAAMFMAAARGMFSLLTDLAAISITRRVQVQLESVDVETLLVDWLNELLFHSEQDGVVFKSFAIEALEVDAECARLRATACGGVPSSWEKTIKAATFSSLRIERDDAGLRADIVFDV